MSHSHFCKVCLIRLPFHSQTCTVEGPKRPLGDSIAACGLEFYPEFDESDEDAGLPGRDCRECVEVVP